MKRIKSFFAMENGQALMHTGLVLGVAALALACVWFIASGSGASAAAYMSAAL